jgi:hypothetical protein
MIPENQAELCPYCGGSGPKGNWGWHRSNCPIAPTAKKPYEKPELTELDVYVLEPTTENVADFETYHTVCGRTLRILKDR